MIAKRYKAAKLLLAVDCIIIGYDEDDGLKVLITKRGFEPHKGSLSLMGGFVQEDESVEDAAARILHDLTGLEGVYMEQMHVFSKPDRDSEERTVVVAFFALIDIKKYQNQMSTGYQSKWFPINNYPELIFDHGEMVEMAKERVQYRAAQHPLLLELLPGKFTIPQVMRLYEVLYNVKFDLGNFSRKIISTGLIIKLNERDKANSKKGAYYYKVDEKKYQEGFRRFLNFVNKPQFKTKN
ncbi:MAG: NUDIX hydrolase [Arachidicoccus sp.]|nr:NUDIX hydrolase [Arachidicoccus sp.]